MPPKARVPYLDRRAKVPADVPPTNRRATGTELPDLDNCQGDIFYMFPKRFERFKFFKIKDADQFAKDLANYAPKVTSATQTRVDLRKISDEGGEGLDIISNGFGINKLGLRKLGIRTKVGDPHFDQGALVNEKALLGDMAVYDDVFAKEGNHHGVFLIAGGSKASVKAESDRIGAIFQTSAEEVQNYEGRIRPGDGEFFGWRDGVSQPALEQLDIARPGQRVVKPGVVVMGYPGDPLIDNRETVARPKWTKDGTLMIFRKLEQNVQYFEDYIEANWRSISPYEGGPNLALTDGDRKKLFGARLVGRYKSGVPLALSPYTEDTQYLHPDKINNFDYSEESAPGLRCPFAAHIRKTVPRDLGPYLSKEHLDSSMIIRAGIPYGEEVSAQEREAWKPLTQDQRYNATSPRGLLFVCYQSSIHNGFYRQTTEFANNDFFPPTSLMPRKTGQDPIIGGPKSNIVPKVEVGISATDERAQKFFPANLDGAKKDDEEVEVFLRMKNDKGEDYDVAGVAKKVITKSTDFEQQYFVTSRGGDYYFVPSISTLKSWAS